MQLAMRRKREGDCYILYSVAVDVAVATRYESIEREFVREGCRIQFFLLAVPA